MPKRIRRYRTRGWKMPLNAKSVTRPGPFGNPFRIGDEGMERGDAVKRYEKWLFNDPEGRMVLALAREKLYGYDLACYCPIGSPCHADVLLRAVNRKKR